MATQRMMLASLTALATTLTGCIGWWGPVEMQLAVSQASGMKLSREFGANVDRLTLALLSPIVSQYSPVPLSHLTGAAFGIYNVHAASHESIRDLHLDGWDRMVRIREPGSDVLVLAKASDDRLCGILVVVREGDQLMIAHVTGRLETFLAQAMEQFGQSETDPGDDSPQHGAAPI